MISIDGQHLPVEEPLGSPGFFDRIGGIAKVATHFREPITEAILAETRRNLERVD
jgi:hypothetical protein